MKCCLKVCSILLLPLILGCGASYAPPPPWPSVSSVSIGSTPYGAFSILTAKELPIRKSVENRVNIAPIFGSSTSHNVSSSIKTQAQYLVVVFAMSTTSFTYDQEDFALQLAGQDLGCKPVLFTFGFGAPPSKYDYCTSEDAFYDFYNIPINAPKGARLAVAFEVPTGSGSATLTVKKTTHPLNW